MRRGLNSVGIDVLPIAVTTDIAPALRGLDPRDTVIFNWCEGINNDPNAYDAVPPMLEALGYAYTGAGAWSLHVTQRKGLTKDILLENKIPTPVSKIYDRAALNGWRRYPAIVKPANEHCSFGITRDSVVDNPQQLKERVQYILDTWKGPALVEDFIDGVEYNVSVWGNDASAEVLPIAAIDYSVFADYHDRLVSFDAKWNPDSDAYRLTGVTCPAPLDPVLRRRIERVGLKAYKALGLRDYGRVDLRVRNGVPYVLDVNANPDITMEGGFARSAARGRLRLRPHERPHPAIRLRAPPHPLTRPADWSTERAVQPGSPFSFPATRLIITTLLGHTRLPTPLRQTPPAHTRYPSASGARAISQTLAHRSLA